MVKKTIETSAKPSIIPIRYWAAPSSVGNPGSMNEKSTALATTPSVRVNTGCPRNGIHPNRNRSAARGFDIIRFRASWFFSVALLKIVTGR